MRTIIAGSRKITDYSLVKKAIEQSGFSITTVICGGAIGVDRLGERWAKENNIPIEYFLPDWDKYGKSAGFRRNEEMAQNAQATIVIWDGMSRGSRHMAETAKKLGLKLFVYYV